MATYSTVTLEREGILAILTLNRPEKMNSLSDQLLADVRGAMDDLEKEVGDPAEDLRSLRDIGRDFTSGISSPVGETTHEVRRIGGATRDAAAGEPTAETTPGAPPSKPEA